MKRLMCLMVVAVVAWPPGRAAAADKQPSQGRIIAVRPAIPDGAKAFVEQQRKLEQERNKKPLFGNWFKKKPSQPPGYEHAQTPAPRKPSSGKSFWDIFNPKKWGKPKPQPPANPYDGPQAPQMQHLQQNQPAGMYPQGNPQPPAQNHSSTGPGQTAFGQMPPPDTAAPASQPG